MTKLEIIQKLKASTFLDEDEESYELEFEAALTDAEIEILKEKFSAIR